MATYSVVGQDGQLYGPANENLMVEWIRQGRVNRQTVLHCHETNVRTAAWEVPALQPALGLSPEEAAQLLSAVQSNLTTAPAQFAGAGPAPMDYRGAQAGGASGYSSLSTFPVVGAVLLSIFVPLFALIYYGLVHGNLPKRRADDPGAGKAIGFMFIPFFNIYWMCFFWTRLCTRINDEQARVGLPPTAPRGLVIAILWCYLGLLIPFLNILVAIAIGVMLVVALIKIQNSINCLALEVQRVGVR